MIEAIKQWTERVLGRGDAAISVPVLDGALKSNRLIEVAEVVVELDAPEDLASDGTSLFVADGARVLRVDGSARPPSRTRSNARSPPWPACRVAVLPLRSVDARCAWSVDRTMAAASRRSMASA